VSYSTSRRGPCRSAIVTATSRISPRSPPIRFSITNSANVWPDFPITQTFSGQHNCYVSTANLLWMRRVCHFEHSLPRLSQPLQEFFDTRYSREIIGGLTVSPPFFSFLKAFDRLPILADALQDAGCENEDILNYCRQAGEHVKGCWLVDRLFEKE
jgi:hypothetical protein